MAPPDATAVTVTAAVALDASVIGSLFTAASGPSGNVDEGAKKSVLLGIGAAVLGETEDKDSPAKLEVALQKVCGYFVAGDNSKTLDVCATAFPLGHDHDHDHRRLSFEDFEFEARRLSDSSSPYDTALGYTVESTFAAQTRAAIDQFVIDIKANDPPSQEELIYHIQESINENGGYREDFTTAAEAADFTVTMDDDEVFVIETVEEKFGKYFGYSARCEGKFGTTTLKKSKKKIVSKSTKMLGKFLQNLKIDL